MADLCVADALLFAPDLGLGHKFNPQVAAYWGRLGARPGSAAGKATQKDTSLTGALPVSASAR
jgi:hypothetical protein